MRPEILADTGAIVAILDPRDAWHRACVEALGRMRLPMLTSMAVLTEVLHFVGDRDENRAVAWQLIRSGAFTVEPLGDDVLAPLDTLMQKYADRPMDFADATLVLLAQRHGMSTVFTIDHDDFETYRILGRKRFRIVPERR